MMKKAAIGMLMLLLLSGCWDRLPLRDLHMVDIAGVDLDEESGDFVIDFVVTTLNKSGQGGGEPLSETTELKGPSIVEAFEQGAYIDRGPFFGINTGIFLLSKKFASQDPARKLAFLLRARYTSINAPVVVFDGALSKFLNNKTSDNKELTHNLYVFIKSLELNGIMPNVSMLHFILSQEEPLEDIALPLVKPFDSGVELGGALLFHQGKSTGAKLGKEQVQLLMLLLGNGQIRQKMIGNLSASGAGRQPLAGRLNGTEYAFSVKKLDSKIIVRPESIVLPKVSIGVRLKINVFELGEGTLKFKPEYVNRMEKELGKHLEEMAVETIKTLQKANCDVLGIGKQLKAYHPKVWESLDWRKDYPRLSIEPKFTVQILNSDAE